MILSESASAIINIVRPGIIEHAQFYKKSTKVALIEVSSDVRDVLYEIILCEV